MASLTDCPVPFEVIGDGYAPEGGTFGVGEQSHTMMLKIFYDDEPAMIAYLLGYSKKGPAPDFKLQRKQPVQHPRYPRLWATKVATKPYVPSWDPEKVQLPPNDFAGLVVGAFGPYPQYEFSQLTVNFGTVQFRSYTDLQLDGLFGGKESYRWVQELSTTNVEIIQLRQGVYKFYSGAGADAFPGGADDIPSIKPTLRLNARTLTYRWFDVPQNFLFNSAGIPTGLDAINAKVNSVEFHGYPPGTLLCLPPKYTPRDAPVDAVTLGLDEPGVDLSSPARYYDVEFNFVYSDPPRPAGYSADARGHNLSINQAPGAARLSYLIVEDRAPAGDKSEQYRPIKSADFEVAFRAATP